MQIFTELQGSLTARSLSELWTLQLGYLLSFLTRQYDDIPYLFATTQLLYISDPKGLDTWSTARRILENGGDDCEGLASLYAAMLLKVAACNGGIRAKDGRLRAVPVLARFGGKVIHAVIDIDKESAVSAGIRHLCWDDYPRCLSAMPHRLTFDPSWVCGMPFPVLYLDRARPPAASIIVAGNVVPNRGHHGF